MNPFGSGAVRFDYSQSQLSKKQNSIDFNQMISVKDRDVVNKRQAFL